MVRKIIEINEEKCNGCGLCAHACHEGAIEMVAGKAKLVSDACCDGLGDCLPACPTGAIRIIERKAAPFDQKAVDRRTEEKTRAALPEPLDCGCPGTLEKPFGRPVQKSPERPSASTSKLGQWPVQLHLVNPKAPYLRDAELLLAADCTAFAHGDFHERFIKGRVALIGCPKFDDAGAYKEKLKLILELNPIRSITVVRMSVPCCRGMTAIAKQAMLESGILVPYGEVVIDTDGTAM